MWEYACKGQRVRGTSRRRGGGWYLSAQYVWGITGITGGPGGSEIRDGGVEDDRREEGCGRDQMVGIALDSTLVLATMGVVARVDLWQCGSRDGSCRAVELSGQSEQSERDVARWAGSCSSSGCPKQRLCRRLPLSSTVSMRPARHGWVEFPAFEIYRATRVVLHSISCVCGLILVLDRRWAINTTLP